MNLYKFSIKYYIFSILNLLNQHNILPGTPLCITLNTKNHNCMLGNYYCLVRYIVCINYYIIYIRFDCQNNKKHPNKSLYKHYFIKNNLIYIKSIHIEFTKNNWNNIKMNMYHKKLSLIFNNLKKSHLYYILNIN